MGQTAAQHALEVRRVARLEQGCIARHVQVPGHLYGQARRVLRDKVQAHDIHIGGAGLDLGTRDERDTI